eukprot:g15447.t1
MSDAFVYEGKAYTSGEGTSCISGVEGAQIYRCSRNPEHEYCITVKEYNGIMKDLLTKPHGEKIVITNNLGENVCHFRNIVKKSTIHFLKKKNTAIVCLGCLNNADPTSTIESCLHGVDITSLFQKFQKNASRQRLKAKHVNATAEDWKSQTSPADKPRHKLKDLEFEKCTCEKVICTDLANGRCVDGHGLPKFHSKQQEDYAKYYEKAFLEPLKMLKTSPQKLTFDTLQGIIDNVGNLVDLNIPSNKNGGKNTMLHLKTCIVTQKNKRKTNSFKPQSVYTVIKKLSQKFEDTIMDVENYNQNNKFDPVKIQVVGPNGNRIAMCESPDTTSVTKSPSCWNNAKSLADILSKDKASPSTKHDFKTKTGQKNAWQMGPPTIMTRLDNLLTTGAVNRHNNHHSCLKPTEKTNAKDCDISMSFLKDVLLAFDGEKSVGQTANCPIMKDSSSDTSASSFSTEVEDFHDQSPFRISMDANFNLADKYRLPPPGFESPIKRQTSLDATSDPVFERNKEANGENEGGDKSEEDFSNIRPAYQAVNFDQNSAEDTHSLNLESDEENVELSSIPLRNMTYLSTSQLLSNPYSKPDTSLKKSTSPLSCTSSDESSLGENLLSGKQGVLEKEMAEKDRIIREKDQKIDEMNEAIRELTQQVDEKNKHIETLMKCMNQLIES